MSGFFTDSIDGYLEKLKINTIKLNIIREIEKKDNDNLKDFYIINKKIFRDILNENL